MTTRNSRVKDAAPFLFAATVGILWEWGIPMLGVPRYLIPTISQIGESYVQHVDAFAYNTFVTFVEAIAGCLIGCVFGVSLGVAMAESKIFRRVFLPYVIGSNAIPVVAVAPLIMLWFGHGIAARSVVSAFLSFFPITMNVYQGLASVDAIYEEMFRLYGASRWELFTKVKCITALPFLFAGLKVSGTLAVIGAVVAEFVAPESGLGFGMLQATYNLDTSRLFGYLIISCILGVSLYGAGRAMEMLWIRRLNTVEYVERAVR